MSESTETNPWPTTSSAVSDPFHANYRALTEPEKLAAAAVKKAASDLYATLTRYCQPGRETALAHTKLEEAVMWAVKGITK
jgi:hypothetical protein